jgi:regulator of sigma E protease
MQVLIQAAQLILSLSILIVLHELGHFVPAKLFKTRVEKFYLFFDPWFSLFKLKKGDTEYGIGWLPLGGYVKISGMIDESMDKEQMALPPQPWEFRSKPAWQRLIIMLGGVTVNVILGIVIYGIILFAWGEQHIPYKNLTHGMSIDSLGRDIGLREGDSILFVGDKPAINIDRFGHDLLLEMATHIDVQRNGQKVSLPVTRDQLSVMLSERLSIIEPNYPFTIDSVEAGSGAASAGLKKGDHIISINGTTTPYYQNVVNIITHNKNKAIQMTLLRGNDTLVITPKVSKEGTIGFQSNVDTKYLNPVTTSYTFLASFPAGMRKAYITCADYIKQMKVIFTLKNAHKQIGGFISIGKAYTPYWDWQHFWSITALLSIVLAIMNILPIPALDGGHVMFLLYEVITRRKPNDKFLEYAQYVGMFLILSLLLYANGNDIVNLFKKFFN